MTNAEARCNNSLRPRKPEGLLGRTAQDVTSTLTQLLNYDRQTVDSDLFIYCTSCREQRWEPPKGWFRLKHYSIARIAEFTVENRQTGDSELFVLLHVLQRSVSRTAKGWFRIIFIIASTAENNAWEPPKVGSDLIIILLHLSLIHIWRCRRWP